MAYDAVIFDKDGVLLNSNEDGFRWADEARLRKAKELGYDITIEESRQMVMLDSVKQAEEFISEEDMTWEDLTEIVVAANKKKIRMVENGEIGLFEGVDDTLETLGVPKGVVTNAPRFATDEILDFFNIKRHFLKVNAPEINGLKNYVRRKKPNPEMLQEVIEEIGAENPVMVGDTSTDTGAAENTGIDSIVVNTEYNDDLEADHRIDHVRELEEFVE